MPRYGGRGYDLISSQQIELILVYPSHNLQAELAVAEVDGTQACSTPQSATAGALLQSQFDRHSAGVTHRGYQNTSSGPSAVAGSAKSESVRRATTSSLVRDMSVAEGRVSDTDEGASKCFNGILIIVTPLTHL